MFRYHTHIYILQNTYIVTRSTNTITMTITNITSFPRVVTDLQPSSAPVLTSMHDPTLPPPLSKYNTSYRIQELYLQTEEKIIVH